MQSTCRSVAAIRADVQSTCWSVAVMWDRCAERMQERSGYSGQMCRAQERSGDAGKMCRAQEHSSDAGKMCSAHARA